MSVRVRKFQDHIRHIRRPFFLCSLRICLFTQAKENEGSTVKSMVEAPCIPPLVNFIGATRKNMSFTFFDALKMTGQTP